jgi:aminopeptidase N
MDYVVRLANIKHRLGWTDNFVNLGNFYPVPVVYDNGWRTHSYSSNGDPFYNDLYNFNVTLTAPDDYIIASSGTEISPRTFRAFAIRDYGMVLSKNFKTISKSSGNTDINYYYVNDNMPEISAQTAVKAVSYFSREFGQYPYPTLAVVQTDFLHGGMEYGSLVYISADVDSSTLSYQTVIVHEIAHQWWYGIVGNNQTETAWIDEGLAEYSTAVFFESHPEYGETIDKIAATNLSTLAMYDEILSKFGVPFDKAMSRDINAFKSGYEYTFCTYCRGMLLFYNIAKMTGYERFNKGLSAFMSAKRFDFGTKEALVSSLENTLNTKLVTYFDNFIAG